MSRQDDKTPSGVEHLPTHDATLEINVVPIPPAPQNKWAALYRSSFFQICVVSALAFCGPAMADAISGLGGGGQATPYTVSECNQPYLC